MGMRDAARTAKTVLLRPAASREAGAATRYNNKIVHPRQTGSARVIRLGIDLGGTKIEIVALDDSGREHLRRRIATPRDDYGATIDAVVALVEGVERELGTRGTVGVGTPGALSRRTGLLKNS